MSILATVGIVLLVLLALAAVAGVCFWLLMIIAEGYKH